MLEGEKKGNMLCCGKNQGGFDPKGKSNGFKSSGCRMSNFGVKGDFLNSLTSSEGQYKLFSKNYKSSFTYRNKYISN